MSKKTSTQILTDSLSRQQLLDQLNQTVQSYQDVLNADKFDSTAKTAVSTGVVAIINAMRTAIEAQLLSALSISYTNTTYVQGNYIVGSPTPQFDTIKGIQTYYTRRIALMINDITAEHIEANFVSDGLGQGTNTTTNPPSPNPKPVGNASNAIIAKGSTWQTGESTIITALGTLNTALMAYVPLIN